MPEPQTLMTGIAFGESPRWHDERLWFADWGPQELIAVDLEGRSEVVVRVPSSPFSIDWSPDGRLLIVSGPEGVLLRREPDGSLATHADLSGLSDRPWNEIVVDGRGNAYVNNIGFVRHVADGVAFPNGMAVTPDNSTLIVAESYANKLTAFDIAEDGGLSNRRVWADLGDGVPDGLCLDAEGAVWYGDVPNKRCVRVSEGGEVLQAIDLDRGCFACMLGDSDGKTLFLVAQEWRSMESAADEEERTGQILTAPAPAASAGWP